MAVDSDTEPSVVDSFFVEIHDDPPLLPNGNVVGHSLQLVGFILPPSREEGDNVLPLEKDRRRSMLVELMDLHQKSWEIQAIVKSLDFFIFWCQKMPSTHCPERRQ